jgi:hypothetical protein
MHIRCSQNKLSGSKLCPFGPTASMSEMMFLEWREGGIVFEIALSSLVSLKRCVGKP